MTTRPDFYPMSMFSPEQAGWIYDARGEDLIRWHPDWAEEWREASREPLPGIFEWDGLLISGWLPLEDPTSIYSPTPP